MKKSKNNRRVASSDLDATPPRGGEVLPGLEGMANAHTRSKFVLCIENKNCEDLEKAKVYPVIPDVKAKRDGYIRVIDESGEDYLYPESHFVSVDIPPKAREALTEAS